MTTFEEAEKLTTGRGSTGRTSRQVVQARIFFKRTDSFGITKTKSYKTSETLEGHS